MDVENHHFSPHLCVGFLFLVLYPAVRPSAVRLPSSASTPSTQLVHTQLVITQLAHTQLAHTQLVLTQLVITQLAHSHTSCPHTTYNLLTHNLSHTQLVLTQLVHTQLAHTQLTHTPLAHTQLAHTQLVITQLTHNLSHTQLVLTQLVHTQLAHTQLTHTQLAHTQLVITQLAHSHTSCSHTTYHLLTHILSSHLHFAWQAWHLVTSTLDVPAIRLCHFRWHGMGLSREPLYLTFQFLLCTFEAIWYLLIHLLNHVIFWGGIIWTSPCARSWFRNFITKIAYYFMEIYLKSTILCGCTLLGFSSHRIISLIQFLLVRVTYDITYDAWRMLHCYT